MLDIWKRPHHLWKWVANNGPPVRSPGFFTCKSSQHLIVSNGAIAVEIPDDKLDTCVDVCKSSIITTNDTDAGDHLYGFVNSARITIHRTPILAEYGNELNRVYGVRDDGAMDCIDNFVVFRENNIKFLGNPDEMSLIHRDIAVVEVDGYHAWVACYDARLPAVLPLVVELVAPASPTLKSIKDMLQP